jgi:antitoxin (DNA-binding transcriptional repressor) of toxin-antitoxin stability system
MGTSDTQASHLDAMARLPELLDRVERGEDIVITRHGRPVARLSANPPARPPKPARAAAEALLKLRAEIAEEAAQPFTLAEIMALRDEGRRH